ncbi:MAG: SCO family protein [Proteobacteria bacterium]|nr:SCO family protein [Pseudomonadota bacterium]
MTPSTIRWMIAAGALLAVAVGGVVALESRAHTSNELLSGSFDPPRPAPPIDLQGSNGARLHLGDQHGKVVILEFGFTYCQAVCPVTLGHLTEVFRKLGDAARGVQVIFVTVDPKRDSPARLAEYLAAFDPSFLGATGTPDELAGVRAAYGVLAQEVASSDPGLGYQVNHSSSIYLIDRAGMLRALIPFGRPVDDIVHDIKLVLEL